MSHVACKLIPLHKLDGRGSPISQAIDGLIRALFQDMGDIGIAVFKGRYDLMNPQNEVISPHSWETLLQPGWTITMRMWPIHVPEGKLDVDHDLAGGLTDQKVFSYAVDAADTLHYTISSRLNKDKTSATQSDKSVQEQETVEMLSAPDLVDHSLIYKLSQSITESRRSSRHTPHQIKKIAARKEHSRRSEIAARKQYLRRSKHRQKPSEPDDPSLVRFSKLDGNDKDPRSDGAKTLESPSSNITSRKAWLRSIEGLSKWQHMRTFCIEKFTAGMPLQWPLVLILLFSLCVLVGKQAVGPDLPICNRVSLEKTIMGRLIVASTLPTAYLRLAVTVSKRCLGAVVSVLSTSLSVVNDCGNFLLCVELLSFVPFLAARRKQGTKRIFWNCVSSLGCIWLTRNAADNASICSLVGRG